VRLSDLCNIVFSWKLVHRLTQWHFQHITLALLHNLCDFSDMMKKGVLIVIVVALFLDHNYRCMFLLLCLCKDIFAIVCMFRQIRSHRLCQL
jgi:hypothetical protein